MLQQRPNNRRTRPGSQPPSLRGGYAQVPVYVGSATVSLPGESEESDEVMGGEDRGISLTGKPTGKTLQDELVHTSTNEATQTYTVKADDLRDLTATLTVRRHSDSAVACVWKRMDVNRTAFREGVYGYTHGSEWQQKKALVFGMPDEEEPDAEVGNGGFDMGGLGDGYREVFFLRIVLQAETTREDEDGETKECSWQPASAKVVLHGLDYEIQGSFGHGSMSWNEFGQGRSLHDGMARAKLQWYKPKQATRA